MAPVTTAVRVLGLDRTRWARVGPHTLWSATALVAAASVLMALNRFGGALVDAPRAFLRLALVGVWGWLGLSVAIWLIAVRLPNLSGRSANRPRRGSLQHTLAAAGVAHIPLLLLGLVIFVAAAMLELLGPGLVAATFVFGFWFPAGLVTAIRHAHGLTLARALAVVAGPYVIWLLVIGRHLLGQVQHLL